MRNLILYGLLLAIVLPACGGAAATEPAASAGQVTAIEGRIALLEAQIAAIPTPAAEDHTGALDGDSFGVAVAQYVMDTAGFHDLDEGLNETKTVDPAYLSTVNRVRKVVAQAPWPQALHDQAGAFVDLLTEFATALDADDGEAAAALATEAHTAQHDLSHAIDNWLGGGHGDDDHGG